MTTTTTTTTTAANSTGTFRKKVKSANATAICTSSSQNVGRKTIRQLLHNGQPSTRSIGYKVPIFQRRYCWTTVQWETIWNDVTHRKQHSLKHSLGRLTCTDVSAVASVPVATTSSHPKHPIKPPTHSDFNSNSEIHPEAAIQEFVPRSCILDGQQRFTTITIFLAAIRDVLQSSSSRSSSQVTLSDDKYRNLSKRAENLVTAINEMLFMDVSAMESWVDNTMTTRKPSTSPATAQMSCNDDDSPRTIIEDGTELQFCRLIPTFCDRLAYYAAILPSSTFELNDDNDQHDNPQDTISTLRRSYSTNWHRPLAAKSYLTAKIETMIRYHDDSGSPSSSPLRVMEQLERLTRQLLDGVDILVFPIDVDDRRTDGTSDLMVVYERLALRDATFCKPHRESEYQSMDGVDLIRNLLLGTFSSPESAIEFYRDQWLPLERYVGESFDQTAEERCEGTDEMSATDGMKLLLRSFLKDQYKSMQTDETKDQLKMVSGLPSFSSVHGPLPPSSESTSSKNTVDIATMSKRPPKKVAKSTMGDPQPPRHSNNKTNKKTPLTTAGIIGGQLYSDFERWFTDDYQRYQRIYSPNRIMSSQEDHARHVGTILHDYALNFFEKEPHNPQTHKKTNLSSRRT